MSAAEYFGKGTTTFSFEVTPTKKEKGIAPVFQAVDMLMQYEPAFIDVTTHQPEVVNGRRVWERFGSLEIALSIKDIYNVETVPHIICGGYTAEETERYLLEMHRKGIRKVLPIRGDPKKGQKKFIPAEGGHRYASGLVKQISDLNRGIHLDGKIGERTNFNIGVAGYPEVHPESKSLEKDLRYLAEKIKAGENYVDYIVTQMFFDVEAFKRFFSNCREAGINLPIVPGLKVLDRAEQTDILPEIFGCKIPQNVVDEVNKYKNNSEIVKEIGISHAVEMCEELLKFGAPDLHFYVLREAEPVAEVMRRLMKR